ncbi:hypothetical protein N9W34_06620 [Rickettsiales bacterium]|nr:hypothetical protein [Rickettsiales bacterium]
MRIFCCILLIFITIGCSYKPRVGPPWMQKLLTQGPDGPLLFQKGWKDGCETGISVTSNAMQRHFYKFTQDSKLARDHVYYTGWKSAYTFCQRYVFQYLRRDFM